MAFIGIFTCFLRVKPVFTSIAVSYKRRALRRPKRDGRSRKNLNFVYEPCDMNTLHIYNRLLRKGFPEEQARLLSQLWHENLQLAVGKRTKTLSAAHNIVRTMMQFKNINFKNEMMTFLTHHAVSTTDRSFSKAFSYISTCIGIVGLMLAAIAVWNSNNSLNVNHAKIIEKDIIATDGVIHVIDNVLIPPRVQVHISDHGIVVG